MHSGVLPVPFRQFLPEGSARSLSLRLDPFSFLHKVRMHAVHAGKHCPVKILLCKCPQHIHTRVIPRWFDFIRKVNDLVQLCHVRPAKLVAADRVQHGLVPHAVFIPP